MTKSQNTVKMSIKAESTTKTRTTTASNSNSNGKLKLKNKKCNVASSASTSDVELIVRKKLITTTTTTTMTPIDSNSNHQSCSSLKETSETNQIEANAINNSVSCVDFKSSNDMEVTMQRTVNQQKANPTSTADAVAALIQDSKRFSSDHNIILKSSSNHTIVSIDNNNNANVISNENNHQTSKNTSCLTLNENNNNTKLMSTVKKEQLEYEFRLKPRMNKNKDKFNENCDDEFVNVNYSKKRDSSKSSFCRRCCGSSSALSTSSSSGTSSDEDNVSTSSEHKNPTLVKQKKTVDKNKKNSRTSKSDAARNDIDTEKERSLKNRVINLFYVYCCCGCCHLFKLLKTKKSSTLLDKNRNNNKSKKNDHKAHDINAANSKDDKLQSDNQSDLNADIQFPPPVSCIRVLRPSNDLTPVRFDSHYNIIQALNSDQLNSNPMITVDTATDTSAQPVNEQDENNFDYDYHISSY